MNLLGRLLSQSGKPRGRFGRFLVRGMNFGHAGLTRWGLTKIEISENATVLDIGCGGGRTLERLASLARLGKAIGIDYSKDSVTVARKRNQRLIDSGRVEVVHGSVSAMPFPDATFDVVSAVETYYFWPDIAGDLTEVRRVMKSSGQIVIIAGMYRGSKFAKRNERLIRAGGMRCFSVQEFEETLKDAGFPMVAVTVEPRKGWICVVSGLKPWIGNLTKQAAR
ncbi:MAG: class I SAM-dependent methyltransferase [Desulfobacterales bacterium]